MQNELKINILPLVGLTLTAIEARSWAQKAKGEFVPLTTPITEVNPADEVDTLIFKTSEGKVFQMYHQQDCCERVRVDDVEGDWNDLIGSPLTLAEESSNKGSGGYGESCTWTFYRFATAKGYLTIRWYGESNGYYSEEVSFVELENDEQ